MGWQDLALLVLQNGWFLLLGKTKSAKCGIAKTALPRCGGVKI
jgi:hypothetical protein